MSDLALTTPSQDGDHLLIVWAFPPPPETLDSIKAHFPKLKITYRAVVWPFHEMPNTRTAAPEGIPDDVWLSATHICSMANLPPPHLTSQLTKLRLIQLTSAGVNHIAQHPVFTDTQIPIANVSGIHGPPISEWIVMHILMEGHRARQVEQAQRERKWVPLLGPHGASLRDGVGKRCGILGYGGIGRQTARVLTALGMSIVAHTASPRETAGSRRDRGYRVPGTEGDVEGALPEAWFSGREKEELHRFLRQDLDYLVVALPLTAGTTGLIGREELEILARSNCFLLNISRGKIIDQPALVESLKASLASTKATEGEQTAVKARKGIRGAALDVTDPEPLPEGHELWGLENAWVTPHCSAVNPMYWPRAMGVLEENLRREGRGEGFVNLVDREKGY